jgi:enterobacteria phage integrase
VTTVDLPYIDRFRDRHGKLRYYYRRPGEKRRGALPAPNEPGFLEAYRVLDQGEAVPDHKPKRMAQHGSFDALLQLYFATGMTNIQSEWTRRETRYVLERLVREEGWGHRMVRDLRREHVLTMLSKRQDRPGTAYNALKKLRTLCGFAMLLTPPWIDRDPTTKIKPPKLGEHHTWTDPELLAYVARHPLGSLPYTVFCCLLFTGQRIADVAKMQWTDIENGRVWVTQQKTRKRLLIPMHPRLGEALRAWKRTALPLFPGQDGVRHIQRASLGRAMANWIDQASLPSRCVPHGLRKAAARTLAELGCSTHQIRSITGQSLQEVERYTRAAEQVVMADAAMAKWAAAMDNWTRTGTPNSQTSVSGTQT